MLNENVPLTLLYKVRENPIIRDKLGFLREQDFDEAHSEQSGEGLPVRCRAHRPQPRSGETPHAVERLSPCAWLEPTCPRAAPAATGQRAASPEARLPGARAPQREATTMRSQAPQ